MAMVARAALLMVTAVTATQAAAALERTYDVTATSEAPGYGVYTSVLSVRLLELPLDGRRMVRMDVEDNELLRDGDGTSHTLDQSMQMHRHPFFFEQDASGTILRTWHHPHETPAVVGAKKTMAASHQLLGLPSKDTLQQSGAAGLAAAASPPPSSPPPLAPPQTKR